MCVLRWWGVQPETSLSHDCCLLPCVFPSGQGRCICAGRVVIVGVLVGKGPKEGPGLGASGCNVGVVLGVCTSVAAAYTAVGAYVDVVAAAVAGEHSTA